jgi:hypothetical protein
LKMQESRSRAVLSARLPLIATSNFRDEDQNTHFGEFISCMNNTLPTNALRV